MTRNNHYVPQWYQKGFTSETNQVHYLNLSPDHKTLSNGRIIEFNALKLLPTQKCFFEYDLYTTFFGGSVSDIIERKLFGRIDDLGARAVRAFIDSNKWEQHERFRDFFEYIDAQKIRTPKGLTWLKERYNQLEQSALMIEMQAAQRMNCTIWLEGVREIVSAKNSTTKFILSDHPVTIYNPACPIDSSHCNYPNDPSISFKGSQTIFPLDKDHCLILTNYEYAKNPNLTNLIENRTNARNFGDTYVRTDALIRDRELNEKQVREINFIIKMRARRFIAASQPDWLYPEKDQSITWQSVKETLLPPADKIYQFGGEMTIGFKDGSIHFQDTFGRTSQVHEALKKQRPLKEPSPNAYCPCGQGRTYNECCSGKPISQRPPWDIASIRDRNIVFYKGLNDILGLSNGKNWDDIRRELSNEQVKEIHELHDFLWPADIDITNLLPRPDDRYVRAIYTGIIDPRVINIYVANATLHFDELIVQNPFINSAGRNPKYSPTKNPNLFKQQTLQNIYLFYQIFPLIELGAINLIPNMEHFNTYSGSIFRDMSKKRSNDFLDTDEVEKLYISRLREDNLQKVYIALPEDMLRRQIADSLPQPNIELVNKILEEARNKRRDDPFSLLQENLHANGGQMTTLNMGPQIDATIFLAKVTGAIVLTDSVTRWRQLIRFQHQELSIVPSTWNKLTDYLQNLNFLFTLDIDLVISLRENGYLLELRQAWRDIYNSILKNDITNVTAITEHLKEKARNACKLAHNEISANPQPFSNNSFSTNFECTIPTGGIEHNDVLRLLATSGIENYLKNVPMAILIKRPLL